MLNELGQPEVQQPHVKGVAHHGLDHDVFGLDVAVDDAVLVGRAQPVEELVGDGEDLLGAKAAAILGAGVNLIAQGAAAVDELHHKIRPPGVNAVLEQAHDVGVA